MLYGALAFAVVLLAAGFWLFWTGARKGGSAPRAASSRRREQEAAGEGFADFSEAAGTVVLLRDNFWDECVFDGWKEDWRKFTAQGVRGFAGVPGGRHQAITTCAKGSARLDFVLYPGEVFVRRLEHEDARWVTDDAETLAQYQSLGHGGARGAMASALVGYRTAIGVARAMRGDELASPERAARVAMDGMAKLLDRALAGEAAEPLIHEADAIGCTLVGVPLTRAQLKTMTATIGAVVSMQGMARQWKRGALVAALGLAMLPGDPYLLEHLANMLNDGGLADDALGHVEAALERASAFDDDGLAQARATKAEILATLGRTSEARAIIDTLVARRPEDKNAARVRAIVYEKVAN